MKHVITGLIAAGVVIALVRLLTDKGRIVALGTGIAFLGGGALIYVR